MERLRYDWNHELDWDAKNGNQASQTIISEASSAGRFFDGQTHLFDLVHVMREIKKDEGIKAIGVFGSRLKDEHEVLRSDLDVFVINDSPVSYWWSPARGSEASRETNRYMGISKGIHIQECTTANWNSVVDDKKVVSDQAYELMTSIRWVWVKDGYQVTEII